MRYSRIAFIALAGIVALSLTTCNGDDDDDDRLSEIRLFSVDSVADTIRELDARNGKELNAFLAPGPGISGAGCGLAYERGSGRLFFYDSVMAPLDIWSIDPDDADPTGTAVLLPTAAPNPPYVGLAHDGSYLMALRPGPDRIDWLNPTAGDYILTQDYAPVDLEEGLDASPSRLFATGTDALGEWAIHELDLSGGLVNQWTVNLLGFQPRALGFARGILFIADMGNQEIIAVDMETLDILKSFPITGATSVCGLAAGLK